MFSLKLFGGAVLEGRGGPVAGRAAHKRRLALLSILAVARRPVSRERLIGLLWPESPTDSARHVLSESLYVLRKELGENVFVTAGDEVGLNEEVIRSDVGAFEAAVESGELECAAKLYRGAFLDGFYVADAAEFERWAEGERDRLARAYAKALETLAEREEGAGRLVDAVEWWRKLASHDPYSSRIALRLVMALDAAGERAAALRFAAAHAALLRDELEVEPDEDFLEFIQRLRSDGASNGTPAMELPAPRPDAAQIVADSIGNPPTQLAPAWPLVGAGPLASGARASDAVLLWHGRSDRWKPNRMAYYGGLAGLITGFALSVILNQPPDPQHDPRRIAVLYFDDHSPGGESQYLANGLTETLIHVLSQVEALDVISRNGVKPYREGRVPLDSIVSDLKVGSVVEGSLQRSGQRLRVTVRLINANTGEEVQSRTLERSMDELFALEDAVGDQVAIFLRKLLGEEIRLREIRTGTRSVRARELFLKAVEARENATEIGENEHRLDAESAVALLRRADSLLSQAEAADPQWTEPIILRGWVALDLSNLAEDDPEISRALAFAEQALRRDPDNAGALELRGTLRWRQSVATLGSPGTPQIMRAAEQDLRSAVALQPSRATALSTLSQLLRYRGAFAEAEQVARRALEEDAFLSTTDGVIYRLYSSALELGDYREAMGWCERGRREFPSDRRFLECKLTLLREDQAATPDPDFAWRLVAELDRLDPAPRAQAAGRAYSPIYRRMVAAAISARAGDVDTARAVIARARREVAKDQQLQTSLAYDEAYLRLVLGEREQALRLLRLYIEARRSLKSYLERDPLFRELHDEIASF
ncbi:MAG TPA: BTAD domain-containing putative transcriptional regulator [Longimicrobium sp.]